MTIAGNVLVLPPVSYKRYSGKNMEAAASPNGKTINVLLIDDHAMVRAGLRLLIESYAGFRVIGETSTATAAAAMAGREHPDIILLDLTVGGESTLDLIPKLLTLSRDSRIVILTGVDDPKLHQRAVQLGAIGLVLKTKAPDVLMKAIEKVYLGEAWLDRMTMASVLAELSNPTRCKGFSESSRVAALTRREHEIISLVAKGLKNKQIAARLYISEITVRHHLTSVFGKLQVADRFELIIYAFKHGLSQLPA